MTLYYTGRGDGGSSNLIGGPPIAKDDPVFDIIGDMDELNSFIGVAMLYVNDTAIMRDLTTIQDDIFSISAMLANMRGSTSIEKLRVPETKMLEDEMARLGKSLPELRKFVLPGGSRPSSYLHVARAIARRVERRLVAFRKVHELDNGMVKYANRLSSFLFVAALYMNSEESISEKNPEYGKQR
ncbi:MAG: cob(I)yrinic acid a,c-diamide adenosyltransferase [Candidatus Micrarchaeota archaeon]|nr:cob(I)yrinic acid a,c-diamide adenosyltransferase [Candidatus Micrarchaeota archaeon]